MDKNSPPTFCSDSEKIATTIEIDRSVSDSSSLSSSGKTTCSSVEGESVISEGDLIHGSKKRSYVRKAVEFLIQNNQSILDQFFIQINEAGFHALAFAQALDILSEEPGLLCAPFVPSIFTAGPYALPLAKGFRIFAQHNMPLMGSNENIQFLLDSKEYAPQVAQALCFLSPQKVLRDRGFLREPYALKLLSQSRAHAESFAQGVNLLAHAAPKLLMEKNCHLLISAGAYGLECAQGLIILQQRTEVNAPLYHRLLPQAKSHATQFAHALVSLARRPDLLTSENINKLLDAGDESISCAYNFLYQAPAIPALESSTRQDMPSHVSYDSLVSLGTNLEEEDEFLTIHTPPARSRPPMFPSLTQKSSYKSCQSESPNFDSQKECRQGRSLGTRRHSYGDKPGHLGSARRGTSSSSPGFTRWK